MIVQYLEDKYPNVEVKKNFRAEKWEGRRALPDGNT